MTSTKQLENEGEDIVNDNEDAVQSMAWTGIRILDGVGDGGSYCDDEEDKAGGYNPLIVIVLFLLTTACMIETEWFWTISVRPCRRAGGYTWGIETAGRGFEDA